MNPGPTPKYRAGVQPARPPVPGRRNAGPIVASSDDLGVEGENNRKRVVAVPVRQRTECTRRTCRFHRALCLEIETVAARRLHDRDRDDAPVSPDDELDRKSVV